MFGGMLSSELLNLTQMANLRKDGMDAICEQETHVLWGYMHGEFELFLTTERDGLVRQIPMEVAVNVEHLLYYDEHTY